MSQAIPAPIQQQAVRRQLEKILAHGLFKRSARMGRFLRLAVEATLDGKADELKEYLIGVEVFDRPVSYDPRVDPIVRVEARRLRSKLKSYYGGDGSSDPVEIELVAGSYAPQIRHRQPKQAEAPPSRPVATERTPGPATTAVLPFVNLSPNPEHEYFSDGLTEEIIHALTKVPGMRVVAWNSAAQLRDRQQDVLAIRQQLQVGTVLTGSVRIADSSQRARSLRVRAQLIDTESGVYLWSETFDREMQDVFAIQEEIARAIVRTLRVQLAGSGEAALIARGRSTVSSYDWYLKGRYLQHRRSPEQLRQSLECFQHAIAADGNSALAFAGLADAYGLLADYGLLHPNEAVAAARSAAERAIALNPQLGEAYASLAILSGIYGWDWDEAERLYARAIELNPGYAPAYHWRAVDHFGAQGRMAEAFASIQVALQLDPLSGIILEGRAHLHLLNRRYDEAIAFYREIIAADPSFYKAYTSMGRAYALKGQYADAITLLEKGFSLAGSVPNILGAMGHVHGLAGNPVRAREVLGQLEELARTKYVPSSCFALAHMGLGEIGRALDWLERGCDLHEPQLTALKAHPVYDPLRGEPRYDALLRRVGL